MFSRERLAGGAAESVNVSALEITVGPGEISEFHRAEIPARVIGILQGLQSFRGENQDLAGNEIALEIGADNIKGAGLGSENVAAVTPSKRKRTQAVFVPGRVNFVRGHNQKGKPAFHLPERGDERRGKIIAEVRD